MLTFQIPQSIKRFSRWIGHVRRANGVVEKVALDNDFERISIILKQLYSEW